MKVEPAFSPVGLGSSAFTQSCGCSVPLLLQPSFPATLTSQNDSSLWLTAQETIPRQSLQTRLCSESQRTCSELYAAWLWESCHQMEEEVRHRGLGVWWAKPSLEWACPSSVFLPPIFAFPGSVSMVVLVSPALPQADAFSFLFQGCSEQ